MTPATIPQLLRDAAARFDEREFIVTADGAMSFAETERRSRQLAKRLLRAGIGKGSRVGMLFPQGPDFLVTIFAITRIGALAVPLSTFYKAPEIRKVARHADLELLIVPPVLLGQDTVDLLDAVWPGVTAAAEPLLVPEVPYLRAVWILERLDDEVPEVSDELVEAVEAEVAPSDPMVMVFTSGATADPKAVIHTHGAQVRQSRTLADLYAFTGEERSFTNMPFFWVGGLTVVVLTHLHVGAAVITAERMDGVEMLDLIERAGATRLAGWSLIERIVGDPRLADRDLSWLTEMLPVSMVHPGKRHNSLGMTETSGPHTAAPVPMSDEELTAEQHGSFGPPVPGVEHKIVDPDTGAVLDEGVEGEICVRGVGLMAGLHKRERADVFDADGWYRTGDRGYFRDGLLFFTGRHSGMIKTGGANVSPREVELALNELPGVQTAFVVGLPDADRGEIVGCMVCPEPGHELDPDALADQLRQQLSSYKVPRQILVVPYEDAPWLPSGKVSMPGVAAALEAAQEET